MDDLVEAAEAKMASRADHAKKTIPGAAGIEVARRFRVQTEEMEEALKERKAELKNAVKGMKDASSKALMIRNTWKDALGPIFDEHSTLAAQVAALTGQSLAVATAAVAADAKAAADAAAMLAKGDLAAPSAPPPTGYPAD